MAGKRKIMKCQVDEAHQAKVRSVGDMFWQF